jgi:selenocysteine lyase/cysteine desulfurase
MIELSHHFAIIRPEKWIATSINCEEFSPECIIMRFQYPGADMTSLDEFKQTLAAADIRDRIREGLIGEDVQIDGPYGRVPLIYADYVASGRALVQVEDFIRDRVMPFYANTHTQASFCGEFMTCLREAARAEIARLTGAGPGMSVIFTGAGSTAGINRIVGLLDLAPLVRQGRRIVVLIGPYEHHSNILPWRETGAEVIEIAEASGGGVDMDDLARALDAAAGAAQIVGSFSAASNVTGILTDVDAVTRLLRARGAVSVWDYGCAGPYCAMNMKPGTDAEKDAIVFSTHKFPGGPGASGVTVIRDAIVQRATPTLPGGGTVSFVSPWGHVYSGSLSAREEGGTPNVTGDIRAALVMLVKEALGQNWLDARQAALRARALSVWGGSDRIDMLGVPGARALPIFSFRVRDGRGSLVHHQFFTRLLSDMTGVQARGGCACAGPYGHRLLGLRKADSDATITALERGEETSKPGWVRLNLSALMTDAKVDLIIAAVDKLARIAPEYASDYRVDPRTARFHVHDLSKGPLAS